MIRNVFFVVVRVGGVGSASGSPRGLPTSRDFIPPAARYST
jgi:hypothetical protein